MSDLKKFLQKRVDEAQKQLDALRKQDIDLQRQIIKLERELTDLTNAARAIGIVKGLPTDKVLTARRRKPPITIKQAVLQVLKEHPEGLIALDILKKINERHALGIVRTSLSPQLSRLKGDRKIVNRGNLWLRTPQP